MDGDDRITNLRDENPHQGASHSFGRPSDEERPERERAVPIDEEADEESRLDDKRNRDANDL
jgi:hypothetical protein